jgi:hypothetical protein
MGATPEVRAPLEPAKLTSITFGAALPEGKFEEIRMHTIPTRRWAASE